MTEDWWSLLSTSIRCSPGETSITHVELDTPDRHPTGDCGAPGTTDRSYTRYWQDDFTRSAGLPDAYFAVEDCSGGIQAEVDLGARQSARLARL